MIEGFYLHGHDAASRLLEFGARFEALLATIKDDQPQLVWLDADERCGVTLRRDNVPYQRDGRKWLAFGLELIEQRTSLGSLAVTAAQEIDDRVTGGLNYRLPNSERSLEAGVHAFRAPDRIWTQHEHFTVAANRMMLVLHRERLRAASDRQSCRSAGFRRPDSSVR